MPSPSRVTILLADEDALRRDGLSAVLSGAENFEVVARVPDGESALEHIRSSRPDIAIVDLNLPKLHGIELIRRVRSEDLRTRIVVLAGTSDDEIIREVVRAGGDGYLLKNGPARHLIDAISYVRDGGQYFSPQLRRDGRDRHLLEEPPRQYAAVDTSEDNEPVEEDRPRGRAPKSGKPSRVRRNGRRPGDAQVMRERIREQAGSSDLDDRDYEIMSMMADGIRPILDRLDEIDSRVAQMEEGDAPVPANPRGWLTRQLADTLTDPRSDLAVSRTAGELEARLPEMIEEAVTRRFNQMADKLQQEIEESHVRTLETFVKNIQVKLVQRVSALEQDMSRQAEAMHQLREYSQRTEDNLSRLINGVDKLAQDLPRRLAHAQQESAAAVEATAQAASRRVYEAKSESADARPEPAAPRKPMKRKAHGDSRIPRMFWSLLAGFLILGLAVWGVAKLASGSRAPSAPPSVVNAPAGEKVAPPAVGADTKTKLLAAQQYTDRKEYAVAEGIYRQVVANEPDNVDALKGLASVLYREDKVDESAEILDRIPKN
jgi:DNA-binding NarL/FixJ family response regulator